MVTAQANFIPPNNRAAKARNRASHALWMQDIRKSLWFKMVFGIIDNFAIHHDGPKQGYRAIKGGVNSPHNTQLPPVMYEERSTDFFTLTADVAAGASTLTFTPSCGVPMTTPDGKDHRFISMWQANIYDIIVRGIQSLQGQSRARQTVKGKTKNRL